MTALAPSPEPDATAAPGWAEEHVCDLFVKSRLAFNGVGLVISGGTWGRPSTVTATLAGDGGEQFSPSVLKVIHWLARHADPFEMVVMHEYLKWRAGGYPGHPWATVLRRHGWTKEKARDVRKALCRRVAADLNARGVPWFDLTPDGGVILG